MHGVWIGTSGWSYKGWGETFYPKAWSKDQLGFYVTQFPTVEINATFYRLPTVRAVENWRRTAPAFVYFNNDWNTRAPINAKTLMEMTGKHTVRPQLEPES
jgi:uncharacterized protein YecE (DUF72 family)